MSLREQPFRIVPRPGAKPSAGELIRMGKALERVTTLSGPDMQGDGSGYHFREKPEAFLYGRLTSRDDEFSPPRYTWEQIIPDGEGDWITPTDGATGDTNSFPAYEFGGRTVAVPCEVVLYKGTGSWVYFHSTTASRPLVWYTTYLHVDNVFVNPGDILENDQQVAEIADLSASEESETEPHLHWELGDGINDFYPTGHFESNTGQTVDLANFLADEFDLELASDHLDDIVGPNLLRLTDDQIQAIKDRLISPVDPEVGLAMYQDSPSHFGYYYYAIDFAAPPDNEEEEDPVIVEGTPVFNTISPDVDDVVTTVMLVQDIDTDIDPEGSPKGWQVILRHELITEATPDDIPLVGVWSRPEDNFPTFLGYVSHFHFDDRFGLDKVGSEIVVSPASPLTTKGDVWIYSTTDTRLGVGTNGQILTADSTQPTGLKWSSAAGMSVVTVKNTPTAVTLTNINTLTFVDPIPEYTQGLSVTAGAAGEAVITPRVIPYADFSTPGIVSGGEQVFAGLKKCPGGVAVGGEPLYFLSGGLSVFTNAVGKITPFVSGIQLSAGEMYFRSGGGGPPLIVIDDGTLFPPSGGNSDGTNTAGMTFLAGWYTGGNMVLTGIGTTTNVDGGSF